MRISDNFSVLNFKAKFLYSDALNDVVQYSIEKNKYEAENPEDLVSKIEYWYEHRDSLYSVGRDYIELAKSLSIEKSAQKVIRMMKEAI